MARPKNPRGAGRMSARALASKAEGSPAEEDLVIVAPDHSVFWVPKSEYRKNPFEVEEGDLYDNLLKAGVVLAQLPPKMEDLPQGMGDARCMCFLVNLASIHAQNEQTKVRRLKRAGTTTSDRKPARTPRKTSRTNRNNT